MRHPVVTILATLLAMGRPAPLSHPEAPRALWLYQTINLADSTALQRTEALWRRAARAGYTKVALTDPKFARLAARDPAYFARARRLRALADELRLEIVPGVSLVGRGNGAMLAMDPNLAEALPVRDALFEVRAGVARLVADPPVTLPARPDRTDPFVHLENGVATIPADGFSRIAFELVVAPWRCYHVSVRLRGEGFRGEPRIRVTGDGEELAYAAVRAPDGVQAEVRDVVFHSLDHRKVRLWFSVRPGSKGKLRWSDWRIEEAGPVNVVRRPGLAFTFAGLREGSDFDPVVDPQLGNAPYRGNFDVWHAPPAIRVRRPDGTRLRASWYDAAVLLKGQVACCLSDAATIARQRDEIGRVRELFGARTLFLMHDEIRALGWDPTCVATGRTPGQIVADDVRACRRAAGSTALCVWNDMFDPHHNAVKRYYLVRGDLAGSWEGLDPAMTIVNWNADHLDASLRFFADRGFRQVFAGYYDADVERIRQVLPRLDRVRGVTGVMYTTWQDRYDDLERFAAICRERR